MPVSELDCQGCGACCVNLPSNVTEGFASWVEVAPDDAIWRRRDLVRKLVVRDPAGVPHLRLAPDGRCAALRGAPGRRVWCDIYAERPAPCRKVQPGDRLCERYRREHGISSPRHSSR
jgi:Fe-S-cluster containining protein